MYNKHFACVLYVDKINTHSCLFFNYNRKSSLGKGYIHQAPLSVLSFWKGMYNYYCTYLALCIFCVHTTHHTLYIWMICKFMAIVAMHTCMKQFISFNWLILYQFIFWKNSRTKFFNQYISFIYRARVDSPMCTYTYHLLPYMQ